MTSKPSIKEFWMALTSQWFTAMSGGLSVPLAIMAFFVPNETAKSVLALTATACFIVAAFSVWKSERLLVISANKRASLFEAMRPDIELIFDANDARFVRDKLYSLRDDPVIISRSWWIMIKNNSLTKSADNVTIRAREGWFVSCSIALAHRAIDAPTQKEPIIFEKETLEPQAYEFVELFGIDPKVSQSAGDVFKRSHEFVIEARARDALTVEMVLKYEPTEPPTITKAA